MRSLEMCVAPRAAACPARSPCRVAQVTAPRSVHPTTSQVLAPLATPTEPATSYCGRHAHTSVNNRVRCAVHAVAFMPDKARVLTGSAAGQFTAWHTGTFNFDTVVQAHLRSIRCMRWSNDGEWLLSGDEGGVVKYWQSNLRPQEEFVAHADAAVRGIAFAPSDRKFATCSDDKSVRVWDFWGQTCDVELRGHNADVYSVSWHPTAALLASGSRDTTVRLWDAKAGKEIRTM
jgi:polyadenylation factor subunit 2